MNVLPSELLLEIIDKVLSKRDLLALRSVSKNFHSLVHPRVLHALRITNAIQNEKPLRRLQKSAEAKEFIEDIEIVQDRSGADDEQKFLLAQALRSLNRFPSLRALRLTFNPTFSGKDDHDADYQRSMIHEILLTPHLKLEELYLSNIFASPSILYSQPSFRELLSPLKTLSLRALSRSGVDNFPPHFEYSDFCDFWSIIVPSLFLEPTQSCLTSLTIHSDRLIGVIPYMMVGTLHFPHLNFLSLGHIIFRDFNPATCFEEFIVRHKETLQSLELHNCPIFIRVGGQTRTWSTVWARFEEELGNLMHFVVERTVSFEGREVRYIRLAERWGFESEYDVPGEVDGDGSALQRMLSLIEERACLAKEQTPVE